MRPKTYETYWNGRRQYTGDYETAQLTARDGAARGFSVWLVRKGTLPS